MTKIFENLQYLVLAGLILAQCIVGQNFYLGQFIYLACNVLSLVRAFALQRCAAEKVKETCCGAITLGLILFNFFIKNS